MKKVVNYFTKVSGIKSKHLIDAPTLKDIEEKIINILKDRIIVGHTIISDFDCLLRNIDFRPDVYKIRDIS